LPPSSCFLVQRDEPIAFDGFAVREQVGIG
jgi:hypothetical protein